MIMNYSAIIYICFGRTDWDVECIIMQAELNVLNARHQGTTVGSFIIFFYRGEMGGVVRQIYNLTSLILMLL